MKFTLYKHVYVDGSEEGPAARLTKPFEMPCLPYPGFLLQHGGTVEVVQMVGYKAPDDFQGPGEWEVLTFPIVVESPHDVGGAIHEAEEYGWSKAVEPPAVDFQWAQEHIQFGEEIDVGEFEDPEDDEPWRNGGN